MEAEARYQYFFKISRWFQYACAREILLQKNTKDHGEIVASGLEEGQLCFALVTERRKQRTDVDVWMQTDWLIVFYVLMAPLPPPPCSSPLAAASLAAWFLLIAVKSKDFQMHGTHKLLEASPTPLVSLLAVYSCFSWYLGVWQAGRGGGWDGALLGCRLLSHLASGCAQLSQQRFPPAAVGCSVRLGQLLQLAAWPQKGILCFLSHCILNQMFYSVPRQLGPPWPVHGDLTWWRTGKRDELDKFDLCGEED